MLKKVLGLIVLTLFSQVLLIAQEDELAGFKFTYVGKGNSVDNSEISLQRYDMAVNLPMPTKWKDLYIINSLNLATTNIHYGNVIAKNAKLNKFHTISYNLGIYKVLKNNWEVNVMAGPYISSNFDSGLAGREVQVSAMVFFTKYMGKSKQLAFNCGLIYHPSFGVETPVPMIGLNWKPNQNWVVNIGFPDFSVDYKFNENTSIGTNLFIVGDIFTLSKRERLIKTIVDHNDGDDVNLIDPKVEEDIEEAKKINRMNYSDYGVGFVFKQKLFKNFLFRINSGYTFERKLEFKKNYKRIYKTKTKDKFFVQAGVSFLM